MPLHIISTLISTGYSSEYQNISRNCRKYLSRMKRSISKIIKAQKMNDTFIYPHGHLQNTLLGTFTLSKKLLFLSWRVKILLGSVPDFLSLFSILSIVRIYYSSLSKSNSVEVYREFFVDLERDWFELPPKLDSLSRSRILFCFYISSFWTFRYVFNKSLSVAKPLELSWNSRSLLLPSEFQPSSSSFSDP
jgi:hypothetical protein